MAQDLARPFADRAALDVYCGVGAFTLALAKEAKHVTGIEVVQAAIDAAKENAIDNGISNVAFYAGDARKPCPTFWPNTLSLA